MRGGGGRYKRSIGDQTQAPRWLAIGVFSLDNPPTIRGVGEADRVERRLAAYAGHPMRGAHSGMTTSGVSCCDHLQMPADASFRALLAIFPSDRRDGANTKQRDCFSRHQPGRVRTMSSHSPTPALLCLVLLTLLGFGLCMQPTFAAAAAGALDDARTVLGNDAGASVVTADVDDSSSAGDCCSNTLCSNCCLHTVGSLHCTSISVASVMSILHGSQRVDEFRARDHPVDIRPPIAS